MSNVTPLRVVGFTGTRKGLKSSQAESLRRVLVGVTRLHHGDCVGADAEAQAIVVELGGLTESHPPSNRALRAFTRNDREHLPKPYLVRNRDIVDMSDELIACPGKQLEFVWGGTWATVGHARRMGKPITIVWPDGTVEIEP